MLLWFSAGVDRRGLLSLCISIALTPPSSPPTFIYAQHSVDLSYQWLLSTLHLSPPGFLYLILCSSETIYYTLPYLFSSLPLLYADDT